MTYKKKILLSVIMPYYKKKNFFKSSFLSFINQKVRSKELIIVYDDKNIEELGYIRKIVKNYNNKVPMKRMGTPDDIAPLVTFLLSNDAKYITGQNIAVDGGWTSI